MTAVKPSVADAYAAQENLIRTTAARFARRFRVGADEALSEANYVFVRTYPDYDPARSTLERRTVYKVWHGLLDWRRRGVRGAVRKPTVALAADPVAPADAGRLDVAGLLRRLGRDARVVLDLLVETPADLESLLLGGSPSPGAVRHLLRRHLYAFGWDHDRAQQAFKELGAAL